MTMAKSPDLPSLLAFVSSSTAKHLFAGLELELELVAGVA